ncbi:hypothetical protein NC651_032348 [Populus alba x Populus x berolinensis]|nr:hypothetical protein NC651_032348 [Populus alba x Populus x berolinensis]
MSCLSKCTSGASCGWSCFQLFPWSTKSLHSNSNINQFIPVSDEPLPPPRFEAPEIAPHLLLKAKPLIHPRSQRSS